MSIAPLGEFCKELVKGFSRYFMFYDTMVLLHKINVTDFLLNKWNRQYEHRLE